MSGTALAAGRVRGRPVARSPEISYDGGKVLFSHCRHYPDLWKKENKLDKATIPEDAFYHLYEMNLDGSGLRQLRTRLAPLLTLSEDR